MTKPSIVFAFAFVLALVGAAPLARAQATTEDKNIASVNFGYQFSTHSFTNSNTFPLFGETGSFVVSPSIGGSGMFDIEYRRAVWQRLSVGIAVSVFSKTLKGQTGTASVPDPIVFNRPQTLPISPADLDHKETGTHIMFGWTIPVGEKTDVFLFAGPSFTHTVQDAVSAVTVSGSTVTPTIVRKTGTATGANFGLDATYKFTPRLGAGIFLRGAPATAKLEPEIAELKVGGFQGGIGVRLYF